MPTETLVIELPVEAVRAIRAHVEAGEYRSESEVLELAVEAWFAGDEWSAERDAAIERGLADIAARRVTDIEGVRAQMAERFARAAG